MHSSSIIKPFPFVVFRLTSEVLKFTKAIMKTLKITSNGRITIPAPIRKKYNLTLGRKVKIKAIKQGILVTPVATVEEIRKYAGILGMKGKMLESLMKEKKLRA